MADLKSAALATWLQRLEVILWKLRETESDGQVEKSNREICAGCAGRLGCYRAAG